MKNSENVPSFNRYLPHLRPEEALYAVTFRLFGSLPRMVVRELLEEKERLMRIVESRLRTTPNGSPSIGEWNRLTEIDRYLARANSSVPWLRDPKIADITAGALRYFDGARYALVGYCIMPNHVHLVLDTRGFRPVPYPQKHGYPLTRIMESIKRYSAREANKVLGRTGPFWQKESYDHVIRDDNELFHTLHYLRDNPVRAGLVSDASQWRWTYLNEKYFIL